jgi:hypothetical protein
MFKAVKIFTFLPKDGILQKVNKTGVIWLDIRNKSIPGVWGMT